MNFLLSVIKVLTIGLGSTIYQFSAPVQDNFVPNVWLCFTVRDSNSTPDCTAAFVGTFINAR